MIDGDGLIAVGLAGSMASAGLWPLFVVWLVRSGLRRRRGLDVGERHGGPPRAARHAGPPGGCRSRGRRDAPASGVLSLLRPRASAPPSTMPWRTSSAASSSISRPAGPGRRSAASSSCVSWAGGSSGQGLGGGLAAACARQDVPRSSRRRPTAPLAEAYRAARRKGPVVDFFRDYEIALAMMNRYMAPGRGPARSSWAAASRRTSSRSRRRACPPCAAPRFARTSPRSRSRRTTRSTVVSGAPASTPRRSRGARRRPTATTSWSSRT